MFLWERGRVWWMEKPVYTEKEILLSQCGSCNSTVCCKLCIPVAGMHCSVWLCTLPYEYECVCVVTSLTSTLVGVFTLSVRSYKLFRKAEVKCVCQNRSIEIYRYLEKTVIERSFFYILGDQCCLRCFS